MGYWCQFDDFNPKVGDVPSYPFSLLPEIANRARSLLIDRTLLEIQSAAEMVDWIIEDNLERETDEFIQYQIDTDGWAKEHLLNAKDAGKNLRLFVNYDLYVIAEPELELPPPNSEDLNEVTAIKKCIDSYGLDVLHFKGGKDYECFSVLALWMLADCLDWLGRQSYSLAGESALKAMDAISHAEHLHDRESQEEIQAFFLQQLKSKESEVEEQAEKIAAQRRTENARKGASKRHEEHAILRQEALEHYETHKDEYRSMEDAARNIAGVIVPVTHRTVVGWISKHRKTQSASTV